MPRCLVALGSNLGDREQNLARAIEMLRAEPGVESLTASGFHETRAVGGPASQGAFLNAAASLVSTLSPYQLHSALARIESALGRQRSERWAARTIDLDLLLVDSQQIDSAELIVPHPRMAFRRFVLEPAAEVAADMVHPTIGWSVARLLEHLNTAPDYVALMGLPGSGKTALADQLAGEFGGRFVADPVQIAGKLQHDSSSGPILPRQIEFVIRRLPPLERQHWPKSDVLAISDYYLDQSLAYARSELAAADLARFEEVWKAEREHTVSPKLVVMLDTVDAAEHTTLRDELLRLAERPQVGPVLFVHDTQRSAALHEISAAVIAMR